MANETSTVELSGIEVDAAGRSDLGRVRKNNEDSLAAVDLGANEVYLGAFDLGQRLGARGALFIVADGMGGEACGECASQMCVQQVCAYVRAAGEISEASLESLLRQAIEAANASIFGAAKLEPAHRGMGTTATAAALAGSTLYVAHVGDSRAYLVREEQITQLTRDQTFLNYLAEIGASLPAETATDPRRSILMQAVGTADKVAVAVSAVELRRDDRLLLCSDGLHNTIGLAELKALIRQSGSLGERCQAFIETANAHGGADNISVILAEFGGAGLALADSQAPVEVIAIPPKAAEGG
jgi:PPM family protein phosphatase